MWFFICGVVGFFLGAVFAVNCKKIFDGYVERVAVPRFLADKSGIVKKESDEERAKRIEEQMDNLMGYTGGI